MSSSNPTPLNSPQNSPKQMQSVSTQFAKKESIEDTLAEPFEPLDRSSIVSAFDNESSKLAEFEAEFSDRLLSAMLEVRAWALARPAAEQDATEDALETQLAEVQNTQDEQEQTRLRLLNFINSIKSALTALTTGL